MDYVQEQNYSKSMSRVFTLSLFLIAGLFSTALVRADTIELKSGHPDRYTVVKGDTLWDIASRFLQDPWRWPNIWNKNEQIQNPHLIYPGDVIVLNYVDGRPELSVLRREVLPDGERRFPPEPAGVGEEPAVNEPPPGPTVRLTPSVHSEPLEGAIPTINPGAIMPFLTRSLAIEKNELNKAGYITTGLDGRVALGSFSQFYARGLGRTPQEHYYIFRLGKALKHPDTGETLAYETMYLGDADLLEPGDPAKLEVKQVKQEILPTDRLLAASGDVTLPYYYPHPPEKQVHGRILSAVNGVAEFGPNTIVSISLGRREGMEEGHVLRIMRHIGKDRDPMLRKDYTLPDENSGLLMVFRTFDRISYGLIMHANRPIHLYDAVQTP